MKLLLLGDVSPTVATAPLFQRKEIDTLFTDTLSLFRAADYRVCNLECAITESDEGIKKFGPCLKSPPETAEVLREIGMDLCGLSNNHVYDYGTKGARDTIALLEKNGIAYTGFGENYEDSRKNFIIERDGKKIAVIAVCEHEYSYAIENRMGSRPFDEYDTMEDVRRAKATCDRVVVMYHGGKEFCEYPSPRLRKLCRALVKNGADVVLCQHSHCIGCYEKFMGGHILYGQGNFHFAKLLAVGGKNAELWSKCLAVMYDTETGEIAFHPVGMSGEGIACIKGAEGARVMQDFLARSKKLETDEWKDGWRAFCEANKENYVKVIRNAANADSTEEQNAFFAHYLDCEAHSDVWRELFPTYNQTNCIDEE